MWWTELRAANWVDRNENGSNKIQTQGTVESVRVCHEKRKEEEKETTKNSHHRCRVIQVTCLIECSGRICNIYPCSHVHSRSLGKDPLPTELILAHLFALPLPPLLPALLALFPDPILGPLLLLDRRADRSGRNEFRIGVHRRSAE